MAVDMMKDKKDKNIIMYCTGGIRCEKASAYMLHHGFKNVFHLEGGIINYATQVKEKGLDNKFIGKNFVFDDRLGERITEDIIANCHQCGKPAIRIPTVRMMAAIFYLFNVMHARLNMKVVAARNARI